MDIKELEMRDYPMIQVPREGIELRVFEANELQPILAAAASANPILKGVLDKVEAVRRWPNPHPPYAQ
jgi:hypothetical protein